MLANSKSEGGPVNQREGQIITEYLAVLVESRIECETTHTSTDILTEKGLTLVLANSKSEGGPVNQREGQIITEYLLFWWKAGLNVKLHIQVLIF